jgi:putative transposase
MLWWLGRERARLTITIPLSQDRRRRIAWAVANGSSIRQAAARYKVSSSAVKLMQRVRKTGSLAPVRIGGHRHSVLEPHEDLLRSLVAAKSSRATVINCSTERDGGESSHTARATSPKHCGA